MGFLILNEEEAERFLGPARDRSKGITRKQAYDFIEKRKTQVDPLFSSSGIKMLHAETFDAPRIQVLIGEEQDQASHLRIYVGVNGQNELCLILVTIKNGQEQLPVDDSEDDTLIEEFGVPCPPKCNEANKIAPHALHP